MNIFEVLRATVHDLFAIYLDGLPRHIQTIVLFQAFAILVLSVCVLGLLIARLFVQGRMSHYRKHFSMLVVNEVLNFSMEEKCVSLLHKAPKRHSFIMNEALRLAILENLHLLVGAERTFLAQKYVELGFADRDLRQCDSIYWWKRLKATSSLGNLGLPQFAPRLYDLIRDRNHYVSIAARIGLSNTQHPLNSATLLKNLPTELLERGNVLTAIAHNLSELQGVDVIKDFLHHSNPAVLRESCLTAIIAVKSDASTEIVLKMLKSPGKLTPTMITRGLVFLRKLDDPSHKPLVTQFLLHPGLSVRLEVAHWFLHFLDEDTAAKFNRLGSDLDEVLNQLATQPLLGEEDLSFIAEPAPQPVFIATPIATPPPVLTVTAEIKTPVVAPIAEPVFAPLATAPVLAPEPIVAIAPVQVADLASLLAPVAVFQAPESFAVAPIGAPVIAPLVAQVIAPTGAPVIAPIESTSHAEHDIVLDMAPPIAVAPKVVTPPIAPPVVHVPEVASAVFSAPDIAAAVNSATNAAIINAINQAVNLAISNALNKALLENAGQDHTRIATNGTSRAPSVSGPANGATDAATASAISHAINSAINNATDDVLQGGGEAKNKNTNSSADTVAINNAINNSGEAA